MTYEDLVTWLSEPDDTRSAVRRTGSRRVKRRALSELRRAKQTIEKMEARAAG